MVPRDADVPEFSGPRSIPPLVASKLGASDGVPSSLAASSLLPPMRWNGTSCLILSQKLT